MVSSEFWGKRAASVVFAANNRSGTASPCRATGLTLPFTSLGVFLKKYLGFLMPFMAVAGEFLLLAAGGTCYIFLLDFWI